MSNPVSQPTIRSPVLQFLVRAMLIVAGIIHLLPLPGVLSAAHLHRLYGLPFTEPNIILLMRHRAVLFGVVGIFLIYAALHDDLVWIAILGGGISAAAFIWLAWSAGGYNDALARIVIADVIAVVCLAVAAACRTLSTR